MFWLLPSAFLYERHGSGEWGAENANIHVAATAPRSRKKRLARPSASSFGQYRRPVGEMDVVQSAVGQYERLSAVAAPNRSCLAACGLSRPDSQLCHSSKRYPASFGSDIGQNDVIGGGSTLAISRDRDTEGCKRQQQGLSLSDKKPSWGGFFFCTPKKAITAFLPFRCFWAVTNFVWLSCVSGWL